MRPILYSVCFMLFIDGINNGLIFPMLPELFMNHKLGLKVDNRYFSRETFYSLSIALFPLSSIFGMPILGVLSDRHEKSKVILYGLIGFIINSMLIMTSILIHNLWLFLFTRLLGGFLSGTYAACNALISHMSNNDQERINNLKLSTLASMLGFIFGPVLLVFINQVKTNNPLITPFIIVCMLSICNFILLWNNFRKTKIKNYVLKSTTNYSLKLILASSIYIFSSQLRKLAFIYLLFTFGFGLFVESLSLHLAYNFNYTTSNIGIFFVIMFIIMAVSMCLLQKLITKHINYKTQIKLSLLIIAILLIFGAILRQTAFINYTYITWIIAALFYIFIPFSSLGFINVFANSVSKEDQGKILGNSGQIFSIGFFTSGLLVGKLIIISYNSILLISGISLMLSYIMFKNLIK